MPALKLLSRLGFRGRLQGSVLFSCISLFEASKKSEMARKVRVEFEGAIYHVMCRGDRRENIFEDDADRARFLETLAEACRRTGWRIHAYVLMSNHLPLVAGDAAGELGGGDAMVSELLYGPL